jgi:hypothetical protein
MRTRVLLIVSFVAALSGCSVPDISYPAPDAGDAGPLTCLPNLDGVIDASELPVSIGTPVSYLVSTPGTVDLTGQTDSAGNFGWDFSAAYASDVTVTIAASTLDGKWYQSSFPGGQWAAPIDVNDTVEGVYAADSSAIYLQGIASTNQNPASKRTLVVYGTPVALYRFPMKPGSSWISTGTITGGVLDGLPYAGTDTYDVADVALGEVDLHDYLFAQAHRVKTTVTVTPSAGEAVVTRQSSFFFECFGEIVRATSKPNETNDDFTDAAEVRRFTTQ